MLGIRFDEEGEFTFVDGVGEGDSSIELEFDSLQGTQTIDLSFENLNHFATDFGLAFEQDGFGAGNLVSVAIGGDGTLDGIASNGKRIPLAQLAIARFNVPRRWRRMVTTTFRRRPIVARSRLEPDWPTDVDVSLADSWSRPMSISPLSSHN